MKKITIILSLLIAVLAIANVNILVIDFAGEHSRFHDPDSILDEIRPIDAIGYAFDNLLESPTTYNINDSLVITYDSRMPASLSDYNIVILQTGWRSSGAIELSLEQRNQLKSYILEHTVADQTALIIEGNDYCFNYCDTSSSHYTWHSSSEIFASVLRSDSDPSFDYIYGWAGSFAEGLEFDYPGYGFEGPGFSPDDIVIDGTSPYSEYATYLFDGGSKGPARGMQRRGYTDGSDESAGATAVLPFVFGNLKDGEYTKAELMYRIVDFSTFPIGEFDDNLESRILIIDSTYNINFYQFDAVHVSEFSLQYSTDAGSTWVELITVEPETDFSTFEWTVPERESDECFLRMDVSDMTGNKASIYNGPFTVSFDDIDETIIPEKLTYSAFPNPFNAAVNIACTEGTEVRFVNINGKTVDVKKSTGDHLIWKPDNLPGGIYFAEFSANDSRNTLIRKKLYFIK